MIILIIFFIMSIFTNIILLILCKKLRGEIEEKEKTIQGLRSNFAIYYNATEMEILYLKDEIKNQNIGCSGVDFSQKTRKIIENDLQSEINIEYHQ